MDTVCLTSRILQEALKDILVTEIGTYAFNDVGSAGFIIPAISVGKPPAEAIVDGLEIVLPLFPHTPDVHRAGKKTIVTQYWDIKLVARSYAAKTNLVNAINKLMLRVYCADIQYLSQKDAIGDYEMVLMTIKTDSAHEGCLGTQKEFIEPAAARL